MVGSRVQRTGIGKSSFSILLKLSRFSIFKLGWPDNSIYPGQSPCFVAGADLRHVADCLHIFSYNTFCWSLSNSVVVCSRCLKFWFMAATFVYYKETHLDAEVGDSSLDQCKRLQWLDFDLRSNDLRLDLKWKTRQWLEFIMHYF